MSIIWCGGEKIDFMKNSVGNITVEYNSNYCRSAYARCYILLGGGAVRPVISNDFTPVGSGTWLHWVAHYQSTAAIDTDCFPVGLINSTTGDAIGVGFDANDYWSIGKRTSAGTVTWFVSENIKSIDGDNNIYDLHIENYGVSGAIHFYVNGSLLLTYSGDITVGSTTEFNRIRLDQTNGTWGSMYSELIVADENTRLMSLKTLVPNGAGDASQWDGTYANVDEYSINDADTVYTDVVEEDMQFALTGMPAGNFICKGVKIAARATDGIGGIGMQMGIKTNGVVHLGDTITLGGAWDNYEAFFNQNPETENRFTPAEIEALQLAFRSKSTA